MLQGNDSCQAKEKAHGKEIKIRYSQQVIRVAHWHYRPLNVLTADTSVYWYSYCLVSWHELVMKWYLGNCHNSRASGVRIQRMCY